MSQDKLGFCIQSIRRALRIKARECHLWKESEAQE